MPFVTPELKSISGREHQLAKILGFTDEIEKYVEIVKEGFIVAHTHNPTFYFDILDYREQDDEWQDRFNSVPGTESYGISSGNVRIGEYKTKRIGNGDNVELQKKFYNIVAEFPQFGVCDSPQQFINNYERYLAKSPYNICVMFCHIAKDETNKGRGGGWRWHKWGPYIGYGKPQYEYLDDEDGFDDGVYTFHVYPVTKSGI